VGLDADYVFGVWTDGLRLWISVTIPDMPPAGGMVLRRVRLPGAPWFGNSVSKLGPAGLWVERRVRSLAWGAAGLRLSKGLAHPHECHPTI